MTEYEKMKNGEMYLYPEDEAFIKNRDAHLEMLFDYNHSRPFECEKRNGLLKKMFAGIGENCKIEQPFYANLGGMFVHFGNNVYANFGFSMVDDGEIFVEDGVMFGPNVTLTTAGHAIEPVLREKGYLYCEPIHIGRNVWIGTDVTILPGVTIGANTVIGAHSTVTGDIPANVVAYGSPCRVVREISEHDRKFYFRGKIIPNDLCK